jgi:hypothetical protein
MKCGGHHFDYGPKTSFKWFSKETRKGKGRAGKEDKKQKPKKSRKR